jgi:hypothetical protein
MTDLKTQLFARICTAIADKKSKGFDKPRKTEITITGHPNTNYVR